MPYATVRFGWIVVGIENKEINASDIRDLYIRGSVIHVAFSLQSLTSHKSLHLLYLLEADLRHTSLINLMNILKKNEASTQLLRNCSKDAETEFGSRLQRFFI